MPYEGYTSVRMFAEMVDMSEDDVLARVRLGWPHSRRPNGFEPMTVLFLARITWRPGTNSRSSLPLLGRPRTGARPWSAQASERRLRADRQGATFSVARPVS